MTKEELDRYCSEYYPCILKFCMRRLSKKIDAEDAAQETFLIFSEKGDMLKPDHIKAWLLTTANHIVLRIYTKQSLTNKNEVELTDENMDLCGRFISFEEDLVDYYIDEYISQVYERLNEKEKQLFDLLSDCNLKTGDIAQILGLDPHAISMRKKRLKEKCREIMLEILFY